jgi:hypothetical protein
MLARFIDPRTREPKMATAKMERWPDGFQDAAG